MKLAILLLCHEPPNVVAQRLSSPFFAHPDLKVYLHYDAARRPAQLEQLRQLIPATVQLAVLDERVACAWGEYSLVEATQRLVQAALADPAFAADHLCLISGSCQPIRPFSSLQAYLAQRPDVDFIQATDISQRRWIRDGLEIERLWYHFPFNFQRQRTLFEWSTRLQQRLGWRRRLPPGFRPHFGSQWFCLTRRTAQAVVAQLAQPALQSFLRRCWIPDEFAIQSLVAMSQTPGRVAGHNLTYCEFDARGRPLELENGHHAHLMRQPFFFARKLSPHAGELLRQLHAGVATPEQDLSYFSRVGRPTEDYRLFLARSDLSRGQGARVGVVRDPSRGLMDHNDRNYFVLWGASRAWLQALVNQARADGALPVFDFLFDPDGLRPRQDGLPHRGLQADMRPRRDHDPSAFLHEVVTLDAAHESALLIDPSQPGWLRDHVLSDPNATLICCDPEGLTLAQRAEAFVRELRADGDGQQTAAALRAVAGLGGQLGCDHFVLPLADPDRHRCHSTHLHRVDERSPSATLRALVAASRSLDPGSYFLRHDQARRRLLMPPG